MDERDESRAGVEADANPGGCCCGDPFAGVPAELRPKPVAKKDGLRPVTCPGCAMVYWTNRETDLCVHCEQKRQS